MLFTLWKPKDRSRFLFNTRHGIVLLLLATFASVASAQLITPTPGCAVPPAAYPGTPGNGYALYPTTELKYPFTSDRYGV